MTRRRLALVLVALFLSFLGYACVRTSPLPTRLFDHIAPHGGDPLLLTWVLAWDVQALLHHPSRLFDANIFYPVELALAFSDHLLGVVPFFAPVYLATGNAVAAYNTVLLLSFALSGVAGFLLGWAWTRALGPSIVAGVLFGFAPFRLAQLGHLQLLNFFWAALALVFLDRLLRDRRWTSLAGFTACYWMQVLSSMYLAYMFTVGVVLYVVCVVIMDRRVVNRAMLVRTAAFVVVTAAAMLPPHVPYLLVHRRWNASWKVADTVLFSPAPADYLTVPDLMTDLYAPLFNTYASFDAYEKSLFPGLVLPALVLIGLCSRTDGVAAARSRTLKIVFGTIVAVSVVLSLGPYLIVGGTPTRIPLPYLAAYHLVPGWSGMRVPARFVMLAVLAAIPIAALGALKCAEVGARAFRRRPALASPLVAAALSGLALAEIGSKPVPMVHVETGSALPPVYRWLARERPGPIVELPIGLYADQPYMYPASVHWQPLVNGQTGFFPPTYFEIMKELDGLPGRRAVEFAASLGLRAIVVHTARLSPDARSRWTARDRLAGDLVELAAFDGDVVYGVPSVARTSSARFDVRPPPRLPAKARTSLPLRIEADGGFWRHPAPHGWSRVVVEWKDLATGRITSRSTEVQLPLVVRPREEAAVGLRVHVPAAAGRYAMSAMMPERGLTLVSDRVVEVTTERLPTSHRSDRLAASYEPVDAGLPRRVTSSGRLDLNVVAVNTGGAVWLAEGQKDRGAVRLGWRWFRERDEITTLGGRLPLRYDVYPGERHAFAADIAVPAVPGTYRLEVGLVSEHIIWFTDAGTPPLRLTIDIPPTP